METVKVPDRFTDTQLTLCCETWKKIYFPRRV